MTILPGTLDLLVLRALAWEPTHGTGVGDWIRLVTGGVIEVEEGSLYPALYRMVEKGWITAEWGRSDRNRKARYYQLTGAGRQELRRLAADWARYAGGGQQRAPARTAAIVGGRGDGEARKRGCGEVGRGLSGSE